jgi:putative FmdB family regulatory protein
MPLYEFECRSCRQVFEELVRPGSTEPVTCPNCGSKDAERLLSATARNASGDSLSSSAGAACSSRGGFT